MDSDKNFWIGAAFFSAIVSAIGVAFYIGCKKELSQAQSDIVDYQEYVQKADKVIQSVKADTLVEPNVYMEYLVVKRIIDKK